jgi:nucleotide-binding universal stress UspA family protein
MDVIQVVVGVDGSKASEAALVWATRDAARRNAELAVTHVFDWRVQGSRVQVAGGYREAVQEAAEAIVGAAVTKARAAEPGLRISQELTVGLPAPTLVERSAGDTLVVVGNRGRGGFASLLLGSVSQQVAVHASGPVVVVRGRTDATTGAVVVGVDGSPESAQTLGTAFDEAALRGARLVVVHVCAGATKPWGHDVAPYVDGDGIQELVAAREMLAQEIAPWAAKFPDVVVEPVAVGGHPAEVLIDMSRTAQLVVVGSRGSGGFAGLLLGAVSQQLLHHAGCPVLIIAIEAASVAS